MGGGPGASGAKAKSGELMHACVLQVSATASFTNDLGLDSLDAVEVVMAIEGAPFARRVVHCRTAHAVC